MTVAELLNAAFQHHQANRLNEAVALYREILSREPHHPDALHLLGLALCVGGDRAAGIASMRRAVAVQPAFVTAWFNLGTMLREHQEISAAVDAFREAIRLQPNYAEAHFNLANALRDLRQPKEAVAAYEAALRARPNYVKARINLGQVLLDYRHAKEAMQELEIALRLQPKSASAWCNLSAARRQLGELDAAVEAARQALAIEPRSGEAANNLGAALLEQGKTSEALGWFETAVGWRDDHAKARLNRGLAKLILGDLRDGWADYEWRWRCPDFTPSHVDRPLWDGSPLNGRTILLHAEQGIGDTFQFVRYAERLATQGGRVLFECDRSLHSLLRGCRGIDQLVDRDTSPPPFDVHAPLLSLPRLCGTTFDSIPALIPYLFADESCVARWRDELAAIPGFKIGVQWQGSIKNGMEKYRRIPLRHFGALATVPGVSLISLQKTPEDTGEVAAFRNEQTLTDFTARMDTNGNAFVDTAAVIKCLDLVVTSDTAVAHLAGGLGVPVWIMLPFAAEWRWWRDREDSPWYPTAKLFRQEVFGRWDEPFARARQELHTIANRFLLGR